MFKFYSKAIVLYLLSLVFMGCSDSPSADLDADCKARLNTKYIKKQGLYNYLYKGSLFSPGPTISNEKTCKARWKQGEVVARGVLFGEEVEQVFIGKYAGSIERDYVFKNFYTKTQKEASNIYFSRGTTYQNNSDFSNTAYLDIENDINLIDSQGVTRIQNTYLSGKLIRQRTWHANGYGQKSITDYDKHVQDAKKGLTWIAGDSVNGVVNVNCDPGFCNPYDGDTVCTEKLPLLCIQRKELPSPNDSEYFQDRWSGGNIAATEPVEGSSFKSLEDANKFCESKFGDGWRVAKFIDSPRGWSLFAYESSPIPKGTRLWLNINDQNVTCWKQ